MRSMKLKSHLAAVAVLSLAPAAMASAKYRVPVSPELEKYAEFDVKPLRGLGAGKVGFVLPAELVGEEVTVTMEKKKDGSLVGPNVDGVCTPPSGDSSCRVEFKDLPFDLDRARKLISESGASLEDVRGRIEVVERFSTEPVGVFYYSSSVYD